MTLAITLTIKRDARQHGSQCERLASAGVAMGPESSRSATDSRHQRIALCERPASPAVTCLENIQTDIWVRFQRLVGNQCIYVCAEDAHGTATMLKAEEEGMTPEEWGEAMRASHAADFARFHIAHDNFHSTHSQENRYYSELIFQRLQEKGHIFTEEVEQLYDPEERLFPCRPLRAWRLSPLRRPGSTGRQLRHVRRDLRRHGTCRAALRPVGGRAHPEGVHALLRRPGQVRGLPEILDPKRHGSAGGRQHSLPSGWTRV